MDRSTKPLSCHQMSPVVEARIVELRREHPEWDPGRLAHRLALEGFSPVPGRSSIYHCLVRHGLITPQARRRTRADYKRWERSRAMELRQMDVGGGVRLVDGSESKVITGLDDHARFCVSAFVTARATTPDLRGVGAGDARPHQRLSLPQTPPPTKDSPESWQPVDR